MIRIEGLGKRFRAPPSLGELVRGRLGGREVVALDGVDLRVAPGEIVGVVGANGAGKTTLLRLVAGLLAPTRGRVEVAGLDVTRGGRAVRARVGYVLGDERSFSQALSARENLAFHAALHGLGRRDALARADALLGAVGLGAEARRPFRELSSGMRQRAALARGLVGAPSVLLADEPTRGVDAAGRIALRRLLAESARDRTMLLATHDLDEAALCDRVIVLGAGRVAAEVLPVDLAATLATLADGAAA